MSSCGGWEGFYWQHEVLSPCWALSLHVRFWRLLCCLWSAVCSHSPQDTLDVRIFKAQSRSPAAYKHYFCSQHWELQGILHSTLESSSDKCQAKIYAVPDALCSSTQCGLGKPVHQLIEVPQKAPQQLEALQVWLCPHPCTGRMEKLGKGTSYSGLRAAEHTPGHP